MANPSDKNRKNDPKKTSQEGFPGSILVWIAVFMAFFYVMSLGKMPLDKQVQQLPYGQFYALLENNKHEPKLKSGMRIANEVTGVLVSGEKYQVILPDHDPDIERLLRQNLPDYEIKPERTFWAQLLYAVIGPLLFVGLFWFLMYRGAGAAGGGGRLGV